MSLSITVTNDVRDGVEESVVLVDGEVDVSNADQLRDAIDARLEAGTSRTYRTSTPPASASSWAPPIARARRTFASRSPVRRETSLACSACWAWVPTSTSASRRPAAGLRGERNQACLASEKVSSSSSSSLRS